MPADNTDHLITAARRRHELTRSKAIQALLELEANGTSITFDSVARHGQISRSWLYTPRPTCEPRSSGSARSSVSAAAEF